MNAGNLFKAQAGSGRAALIDLSQPGPPRARTFRELDARCDAVARGLVNAGLRGEDRVAILSLNRAEFVEVLFGAMRAGVVPVPVNVKLAPDTIQDIIRDSGAKLVIGDARGLEKAPRDIAAVAFDDSGGNHYARFLDEGSFEAAAVEPRSVAIQPYTSGSTGTPKGILLTHEGIHWVTHTAVRVRKMDPSVRSMVAAPLYHKNAAQTTKQTLTCGGCIILMAQFAARPYLMAASEHRATVVTGIPTMFQMILRERDLLEEMDLSSVKRIGFGSAPGSDALYDALSERFPNAAIENLYGITEGGPIMFGPHPGGLPRPRNSVGYVLDGAEVRLEGGQDPDEGVLHVRSPGVMLGYHNRPELTAEKLRDGWFDTGDVLRRDGDGFFYFVGRADDMFVCGGENIYPMEVEALLERNPDVMQAVVVPAEDELKAYVPYAFVVPRAGARVSEDGLRAYALRNGPAYAHPRRVVFVDEIPLAGTGKVDRRALTERANAMARARTHRERGDVADVRLGR